MELSGKSVCTSYWLHTVHAPNGRVAAASSLARRGIATMQSEYFMDEVCLFLTFIYAISKNLC